MVDSSQLVGILIVIILVLFLINNFGKNLSIIQKYFIGISLVLIFTMTPILGGTTNILSQCCSEKEGEGLFSEPPSDEDFFARLWWDYQHSVKEEITKSRRMAYRAGAMLRWLEDMKLEWRKTHVIDVPTIQAVAEILTEKGTEMLKNEGRLNELPRAGLESPINQNIIRKYLKKYKPDKEKDFILILEYKN